MSQKQRTHGDQIVNSPSSTHPDLFLWTLNRLNFLNTCYQVATTIWIQTFPIQQAHSVATSLVTTGSQKSTLLSPGYSPFNATLNNLSTWHCNCGMMHCQVHSDRWSTQMRAILMWRVDFGEFELPRFSETIVQSVSKVSTLAASHCIPPYLTMRLTMSFLPAVALVQLGQVGGSALGTIVASSLVSLLLQASCVFTWESFNHHLDEPANVIISSAAILNDVSTVLGLRTK